MHEIDIDQLHALLEQDPTTTVVDVREAGEYASGHVPGAVPVPLSELVARHTEIGALPGPVHLICEAGGRSAQAAAWLEGHGYDVVNVAGGTGAWRAAGLPTE